ncbi:alpha/beta hydrolase family protein [Streptomyces sp. NC-S4]
MTAVRTKRRRNARAVGATLAALALVAAAPGGLAAWQNSYDLRERAVTVRHGGRTPNGVPALPEEGKGPFPLVVLVHGDGPVDAIAWARRRADIDGHRIGLWGAGRAGWVLPRIAAKDPGIRFVIAVPPAVNWHQQGRYNLLAELRRHGASDTETAAALRRRETGLQLLARGAPYEEYVRAVGDPQGMTPARWRFVSKNHTADATADLPALRGVPVLLVLAGHDVNVDTADTEARYERLLPGPALRVAHYPGATHGLVEREVEASWLRLTATAVSAPRALFTEGFLTDQQNFLASVDMEGAKR